MAVPLNGWQRLWIVVVTLWVLVLCFLGWSIWPTHAAAVVGEIRTGNTETRQWDGAVWNLRDFDPHPEPPLVAIVEQDGMLHDFPAGTAPNIAANKTRDALKSQRRQMIFRLGTIWVATSVFVYALGWSVGWVRRGFKS